MNKETLRLIQRVHDLFREKGLTLSVAESCTGGVISYFITALPGASNFFEAGVVSYSADAKKELLAVSPDTISAHGAISEETAREMAEKVRNLTRTDFSVSTTGNLGPEVLEAKEEGLVYIAVNREGETFTKELRLTGNREQNQEEAAMEALRFLVAIVESN